MSLATALILLTMTQDPEPAPPDLATEACVQDPPACTRVAGAHFDAGRFTQAVRLFEALIAATPGTAKYHYFAGIAREGAGDDTAAYVHMRRFLASAADDAPDRERATRRTAAILARTTRISLHTPQHDAPLTLHLRRLGATHSGEPPLVIPLAILPARDGAHELALTPGEWEFTLDPARVGDMEVAPLRIGVHPGAHKLKLELTASPVRHQLTLELGPDRALDRGITIDLRRPGGLSFKVVTPDTRIVRRELPPGTWTYEARARGFIPQKHPITLDGPITVQIQLASKWPEERRKRLKLGLGLAGAGLVTGIVGGALMGYANRRMKNRDVFSGDGTKPEPAMIIADIGAALLGTTLGAGIGAIASSSRSRRLWLAEAGVGALTIVAATSWYATTAEKTTLSDSSVPRTAFELNPHGIAAAGLLGLGSSLLTASVVTLINKRGRPRTKNSAQSRRRATFNTTSTGISH